MSRWISTSCATRTSLLGASPEHARIDPDQLLILMDHVRCAAFELAFRDGERFGKEDLGEILAYLEQEQVLHHEGERWHWMADSYPANSVSLRSVADGNFVVVDVTGGKQDVMGEVDYSGAAMTLYEGAIYLLQARPHQVEKLDWPGRKAFVRQTRADYYTEAIDYTRLKILDRFEEDRAGNRPCARGEVHLLWRVAGYKKIRYYTPRERRLTATFICRTRKCTPRAVWWRLEPGRARTGIRRSLDGAGWLSGGRPRHASRGRAAHHGGAPRLGTGRGRRRRSMVCDHRCARTRQTPGRVG